MTIIHQEQFHEQFRGDPPSTDELVLRRILNMLEEEDTAFDFPTLRLHVESEIYMCSVRTDWDGFTPDSTILTRRILQTWYAEFDKEHPYE